MRDMDSTISTLRAVGEPTRFRLLAVLSKGELTVSELTQVLGQSQPRISRHLKLMCDAGLLERFREGAWVFYRITEDEELGGLVRGSVDLIPFDDVEIRRDLERLDRIKEARRKEAEEYFSRSAEEWAEIRSLHIDESDVEDAMLDLVGEGPFEMFVDLGTGTGRVLELLSPRIGRGIGFDLSHDMLAIARSKLEAGGLDHCQVRQGDLYSLPFAVASDQGGDADLVCIHQVLHFLTEPGAAVAEAVRIMRPGGLLLIVDFAPHELEALRTEHAHRRLGFSNDEVKAWFDGVGIESIAMRELPPANDNHQKLTVSLWLGRLPEGEGASKYIGKVAAS